ncbi:MAG: ParB/RepB/Spo0J family partition protein [Rickettsiales bacterium]|jgi:ParB family chromosome partitioning protein|nr:ParB/RepB/Spo0J family partition protein [Rickettsiales bacterium]
MQNNNNKLGRGLSALLGDSTDLLKEVSINNRDRDDVMYVSPSDKTGTAAEVIMMATGSILTNPFQPRRFFSPESINELAESIKAKGLLQPILVRPTQDIHHFEIISGERRFRAIRKLGYESVPVIVKHAKDSDMLEIGLMENLQREDLNPVEEAKGYKLLTERFGYTQENLSQVVHKSRPYISNIMRILTLPEKVLTAIESGQISVSHARTLIREADPEGALKRILQGGLSVRDAEKAQENKQEKRTKSAPKTKFKNPEIAAIEDLLTDTLKAKSKINMGADDSGEIKIQFSNMNDLDRILSILNCVYNEKNTVKIPKFGK